MGKKRRKQTQRFRDAVFKRDKYTCVGCGFVSSPEQADHELAAHHITPRQEMPNGGYVQENGVTLCDPSKAGKPLAHGCLYKAEMVLQIFSVTGDYQKKRTEHEPFAKFTPSALYEAIGSSHEAAVRAAEYLT